MGDAKIREASRILSLAQQELGKMGIVDIVNNNKKSVTYWNGVVDSMYEHAKHNNQKLPGGKVVKIVTTAGEYILVILREKVLENLLRV